MVTKVTEAVRTAFVTKQKNAGRSVFYVLGEENKQPVEIHNYEADSELLLFYLNHSSSEMTGSIKIGCRHTCNTNKQKLTQTYIHAYMLTYIHNAYTHTYTHT